MIVRLAFGKTGLPVELPEGFRYHLLETKTSVPLSNPDLEINLALDAPISCTPVIELARNKRTAAISVCDITRPVPNDLLLPPLLKRLEAAGIPRGGITILIATGLHRPATEEEIKSICGDFVARNYHVVNHHARELSEHRYLGTTSSGTPVFIDERFVSADLHITVGFIEPHLMAGFSGSRKLIAPGLAAQETIKVLHSSKFMRDKHAVEGSIDENPLHRELLEIARMARHDFSIDVALSAGDGGTGRPITGIFTGEPVQAHRRGVQFVGSAMLELLKSPVEAAITTSAGYPLDLTFYQATKGVTSAAHIVKPGGRILLVASCDEGAGGPDFSDMLRKAGSDRGFLERISNRPVVVDQWTLEKLALVTMRAEVHFYVPGLPPDYHAFLWGKVHRSPKEAITSLLRGLPPGANVAVIPDGPYVLAKVSGS